MALVETVTSKEQMSLALLAQPTVVCHFWASWSDPCKHIDGVLEELAKEHKATKFVRVEAEEVYDVSEKYNVSSVPYVVFFKNGKPVDTLDGADVPALFEKVSSLAGGSGSVAASVSAPTMAAAPSQPAAESINDRIAKILASSPVLLFMKGDPSQPRCGFSRRVVEALQSTGVKFDTFDILGDEDVRQGLKEYSNWPTYPQLYVKGELMGGCDIIEEMHGTGELATALKEAVPAAESINDRIAKILASSSVLLFMKGDPSQPRCGFSRRVVEALQSTGVKFDTFDILEDEDVRQGLKEYSNWPTYPQLYVKGELMGGCDIIEEMHSTGELASALTA